jgi:hypothetical protein
MHPGSSGGSMTLSVTDECRGRAVIVSILVPHMSGCRHNLCPVADILSSSRGTHPERWAGSERVTRLFIVDERRITRSLSSGGHSRDPLANPPDAPDRSWRAERIYNSLANLPLPRHCRQGAGKILRPGCPGCATFGNPVPSQAGQSTSVPASLGLGLFIISFLCNEGNHLHIVM